MSNYNFVRISIFCFFVSACVAQQESKGLIIDKSTTDSTMSEKVLKTDEEWRKELTPEQYYVLRQKGTERPGTGEYNLHFEEGTYYCSGCNAPLFKSDSKFESHCGWPSFDAAISDSSILEIVDRSHGMVRTEIICAKCEGHIGHVFNDGPTDTGLRYCVNSVSIEFEK